MKEFLLPQSLRFYGGLAGAGDSVYGIAQKVASMILSERSARVTSRELHRSVNAWRVTSEQNRRAAIQLLKECGWIIASESGRMGGESAWIVAPQVHVMFQFINVPNKRQVMDLLKQSQPQPDPLEVEKLKQSGAKTEADVRLKNAQTVQIEHEIGMPQGAQPEPIDPLEIERVRQSGMTAQATARKTHAEAVGKEIENAVFSRHPSALLPQPKSIN